MTTTAFVSQTVESVYDDLTFLETFIQSDPDPEGMSNSQPALARMLRRMSGQLWTARVLLEPGLDRDYAAQLKEELEAKF